MAPNPTESRLAAALLHTTATASQVLKAQHGSQEQWQKAQQLSVAAHRLCQCLGGDQYQPPAEAIDSEEVEATIADISRYYNRSKTPRPPGGPVG